MVFPQGLQHDRGHQVAPDMCRLEAGQENAIKLAEFLVGQLPGKMGIIHGQLLDVCDLRAPGQALAEADSDRSGDEGVEVGVEIGCDPKEVEKEAQHDGPLGCEFVDEDRGEEACEEHGAMHASHGNDSQPAFGVEARLEVLYGAKRCEDKDEA